VSSHEDAPQRWPAAAACPAYSDGRPCPRGVYERDNPEAAELPCQTFECDVCGSFVPWCVGSGDSETCDACVDAMIHNPIGLLAELDKLNR
jgi:hypothetical protein